MRLQIERAVYGGAGLSHQPDGPHAGRTIFVPFTLPGEVVEAELTGDNETFGNATLTQVLISSADRVAPGCAHFGTCGGCHYQHANYAAQVAIKRQILRETLHHAGLSALPAIQTHTAEEWRYRNRARLRLEVIGSTPQVGYNRRGSNQFLAIHECPILAPVLWRAAESLRKLATENSTGGRWASQAIEAEFFANDDLSKLQLTMFVRKELPGFRDFCDRLHQMLPELAGAGVSLLPSQSSQKHTRRPRPLHNWGADGLNYRIAEESYWVGRGSFFQVNRFLLQELVTLVTKDRKGPLAWDLYAGVGLFSHALTRQFDQVVAVEAVGSDLTKSFKGPGRYAVEATAVEFLRRAVIQRDRPELIVVDPPRAGLGAEVCALLARISAAQLVYVSCDPVTLARDLNLLTKAGYTLVELHMVDLFPQTFHLETIVILRKQS